MILRLVGPGHVAKQLQASDLIRTVSDSSGWAVRRRTSKFVTHSDQVMFRIRRRHHWSKASILFSIALVMDHVSAPYKNTGSIVYKRIEMPATGIQTLLK